MTQTNRTIATELQYMDEMLCDMLEKNVISRGRVIVLRNITEQRLFLLKDRLRIMETQTNQLLRGNIEQQGNETRIIITSMLS